MKAMESPFQSPCPELLSSAAEGIGREGMVTVWDDKGGYLGCMGVETWLVILRGEKRPSDRWWRDRLLPLWSNRWWGLYHGPKPLRAFAAWVLPHWYGSGE